MNDLWVQVHEVVENDDELGWRYAYRKATVDEALAVVRRGVESGTIKGEVVWLGIVDSGPALHTAVFWDEEAARWNEPRGPYVLIPVSGGDSE